MQLYSFWRHNQGRVESVFLVLFTSHVRMEDGNKTEGREVQPYMFEPNPEDKIGSDDSGTDSSTSIEDDLDEEFEAKNTWRLKPSIGVNVGSVK